MTWPEVLSAAISGTARGGLTEGEWLNEAAMLTSMRRAGHVPLAEGPPPADPAPTQSYVAEESAHVLRQCLEEDDRLVTEWCRLAANAEKGITDVLLPEILAFAAKHPKLKGDVVGAIGPRGRWLARLNLVWAPLVVSDDLSLTEDLHESWQEAGLSDRKAVLQSALSRDRSLAIDLVTSTWKEDPARARTEFVELLAESPVPANREFLQSCLADRSTEVRYAAAIGLARLPGSELADEAFALASEFVQKGFMGVKLTLPEGNDERLDRFGIASIRGAATPQQRMGRLTKQIGLVPPSRWTDSGDRPEKLLGKVAKDETGSAVIAGWTQATHTFKDSDWATALVHRSDNPIELVSLLPDSVREGFALGASSMKNDRASWYFAQFAFTEKPWSREFTRSFLDMLEASFRKRGTPLHSYLLKDAVFYIDPSVDLPTAQPPDDWTSTIDYWQRILHLRRWMHAHLTRSPKT